MVGFAVFDMEQNRPTRQTPGFPDLFVMGRGRILFVEVKSPTGELSGAQEIFRDVCLENGGEWHLWRSVEDAKAWLVSNGYVREAA